MTILPTILLNFFDWFKTLIPASPISTELRKTFVLGRNEDVIRQLSVSQDSTSLFYISSWVYQLEPTNYKVSDIVEYDPSQVLDYVYRVYPVKVDIQGNFYSNDNIVLIEIYEELFKRQYDTYTLLVDVNIEGRIIQVPISTIRLSLEGITTFGSVYIPTLPYNVSFFTLLIDKEGEGKPILYPTLQPK